MARTILVFRVSFLDSTLSHNIRVTGRRAPPQFDLDALPVEKTDNRHIEQNKPYLSHCAPAPYLYPNIRLKAFDSLVVEFCSLTAASLVAFIAIAPTQIIH